MNAKAAVGVLAAAAVLVGGTASGGPKEPAPAGRPAGETVKQGEAVKRAIDWLAANQLPGGGWGQGEESRNMGGGGEQKTKPNVADTCMAVWALLRAGHSPSGAEHAERLRKALQFVCSEVEASDEKSLYVTGLRGTRTQSKLGTYIDTFLAAAVLAEVKGKMPDEAQNKRVLAALDKVMDKIEKNQRADGSWENQGWATALAQGMATKAVNLAAQSGARVDEKVRRKAEEYARGQFKAGEGKKGGFSGAGSAGVDLYAAASSFGGMKDSDNTNRIREEDLKKELAAAPEAPRAAEIQTELKRIAENRETLGKARDAVVAKLSEERFVSGFGSNGGEEFLSYLRIGEGLADSGGAEWDKWRDAMARNLSGVQNADGSWSGHHCITGKTFCTSAALMVLNLKKGDVGASAHIKRR